MEGFLDLLLGLFSICAFIALMIGFPILVSKLFNVRIISRSGNTIADPSTFDSVKDWLKSNSREIMTKIKSIDYRSYLKISSKSNSKPEKLVAISDLYERGLISKTEFQILKKEIIES